MKPVWIVIAVLIALVGVTVLNSSDLLNGGKCYNTSGTEQTTFKGKPTECERVTGNTYEYSLDTFTGFRSLILILPLIIVALIIYGAWRSGGLGSSRGGISM